MRIQALIFASCATAFAEIVEYSLSREECQAAGFNPETLKCSTCKQLTEFNLDFLMTDCESCCTKDQDDEHEKYPMAHIEVCECNLGRFPQVQGRDFIDPTFFN
ncbi:hypothetical protein NECAME_05723 [Necator americanus]|uniref:Selenoprotein F/M domain-containing protein n=1 Tax=Necator americanus TaxID=51031 RepID=W2TYS2_NECAM|nr:hypothetical protein NECAME_05723 [Necator americanus]ETN87003.1 hypothetical protein NECAME_05723 [Necator americanus]